MVAINIIDFPEPKSLKEELNNLIQSHLYSIRNDDRIRADVDNIVHLFSERAKPNNIMLSVRITPAYNPHTFAATNMSINIVPENLYTAVALVEPDFNIWHRIPEFGTFETYKAIYDVYVDVSGVIQSSIKVKEKDEFRDSKINAILK